MAEKETLDLGEEKKKSSKGIIFIVLGAVLGTLVAVFAALYFMGIFPPKDKAASTGHGKHSAEKSADHAERKPIIYLPLQPAFVANFKNSPDARLLQVEINVASTDQAIIDAVKKHTPMIRNNLLLLLGGEDPAALKTLEGKEALRGKIKGAITKVVVAQTGKKSGVDDVFFTGFIMQ
jgi:flagellar FliL protein